MTDTDEMVLTPRDEVVRELEVWGRPGRRPNNASERQWAYACAKLAHPERTNATCARLAGYSASSESVLASAANKVSTSPVTKALLELGRSALDEGASEIADEEEVAKLLTITARNVGTPAGVQACNALAKYHAERRTREDPLMTFQSAISGLPVGEAAVYVMRHRMESLVQDFAGRDLLDAIGRVTTCPHCLSHYLPDPNLNRACHPKDHGQDTDV